MVLFHIVCTYVRIEDISGCIYCRVRETLVPHMVSVHGSP